MGRRRRTSPRTGSCRTSWRTTSRSTAPSRSSPTPASTGRAGRDTTFASPAEPLDDAAFFYFVRITPLEVGKKYVFDRYFKKEKNPVTIEVVKREKMELPDGSKVQCLVLHPVIDTKGLFSKRSDTRIWLTDDERRLPVQIRSKFPFGTITLRLKDMVVPAGAASTSGG